MFGGVFDIGGIYAALLQGACVMVVVGGLEASKYTVNTFCLAKVPKTAPFNLELRCVVETTTQYRSPSRHSRLTIHSGGNCWCTRRAH